MGFSGGGGGQINAHVHDNNAGQGGNLTQATLLSVNSDTPTLLHNLMPIGSLILWGGTRATIPDRFIPCDGASLLRAGTYADLFDVIGVQFGSADGTHFNAPNMDEQFGRGSANANDSGATGGADTVSLTEAELAVHDHALSLPSDSAGGSSSSNVIDQGNIVDDTYAESTEDAGSGDAHENRPAFVEGIYIVRF